MANCITGARILGTLVLLALTPLTPAFYGVYLLTGVTDALDGWVARKTGTVSRFGAKLDSVADLLFYAVLIGKLFPALYGLLPRSIWAAVLAIAAIRLCAYAAAAVRYHTFASAHTWLNKLTGGAVFLIPCLLTTSLAVGYCWGVCAVAGLASVEELAIYLISSDYDGDRKSLFQARREDRRLR